MLLKYLYNNEKIKLQLDDIIIEVENNGLDDDYDTMISILEYTLDGVLTCYSFEEIECGVDELNLRIMKCNKFRIWVNDEEI